MHQVKRGSICNRLDSAFQSDIDQVVNQTVLSLNRVLGERERERDFMVFDDEIGQIWPLCDGLIFTFSP